MNYFYSDWRGTYKGRGDKAEKYPYEGIFQRDEDEFNRYIAPNSENYGLLPTSTNPRSAASNQRTNIKWLIIGGEADIPGIITTSFFRGNTLQRINNDSALKFSKYIANKLHNTIYKIGNLDNSPDSIFDLISPNDCEDIICMWLFKKYGYITIPSTCKSSTPLYECVLINHDKDKSGQNKKNVYIQVKKGEIDLDTEKFKHLDGEVYLFTAKGQIKGKKYENIKILDPKEIYEFIMNSENDNILPEKAIRWREVLMEISK